MSELNCNNVLIQPNLVFQVGECFCSFDELCDRMEALKKQNFVHYWRRDSRTVKGASMVKFNFSFNQLLGNVYFNFSV